MILKKQIRLTFLGMALGVCWAVRLSAAGAPAWQVQVTTDKPDAIYRVGETISFGIEVFEKDSRTTVAGLPLLYSITGDGGLMETGQLVSVAGRLALKTAMSVPGWIMIEVDALNDQGQKSGCGRIGAMADPYSILPAAKEPEDFDEFWKKQRLLLDAVPLNPRRTPVETPEAYRAAFDCFDIQLDCVGDAPVSGYLCMPKNAPARSLAALVNFHGYGVFSAHKDFSFGTNAIFYNINANGLRNGQPPEYYKQMQSVLRYYPLRDLGDPEAYYFRFMFLRVLRALDYIRSLPEWDGANLLVQGGSQGGAQALVAAALDPKVSLCWSSYPALCDHAGFRAKRASGWPHADKNDFLKDNPALLDMILDKTLGYYDCAFFARRIRCETYLSTGFLDTICPPCSVFAAYNSLTSAAAKAMSTEPRGGHSAVNVEGDRRIREILRLPAPKSGTAPAP